MENIQVGSKQSPTVKRGRGRPRKNPVEVTVQEKRPRGRPRKYEKIEADPGMKRSRGRPRKYAVLEKEQLSDGTFKPVMKKVDSGHLVQKMMNYFTKLLIIHHELSKEAGPKQVVFDKLKNLDFQMAEMCKKILVSEYKISEESESVEEAS